MFTLIAVQRCLATLQWVHSLVAVVIRPTGPGQGQEEKASMGPQSGSCGYGRGPRRPGRRPLHASMGPQSGSCGYGHGEFRGHDRRRASMGPQSGSCGYRARSSNTSATL